MPRDELEDEEEEDEDAESSFEAADNEAVGAADERPALEAGAAASVDAALGAPLHRAGTIPRQRNVPKAETRDGARGTGTGARKKRCMAAAKSRTPSYF